MGSAYLGEIFMGGWNFGPHGFATCDGQLLSISQNTALFSLLGTNFGGNGTQTFGLPDLRGRLPMHWGQGPGLSPYNIGQNGGQENVTLIQSQLPAHNHSLNVNGLPGNTAVPSANTYLAKGPATGSGPNATSLKTYTTDTTNGAINPISPGSISNAGGNQPHTNIQPYLCVTFVIALQGIFPSRN